MKILGSMGAASKQKDPASNLRFAAIMQLFGQSSSTSWLYLLGLAIAAIGVGVSANQAIAQVYFQRPISVTRTGGTVSTRSGVGLNVRSGPGLNFDIIGWANDGVTLDVTGIPTIADGYRWQRITPRGWVATDYLAGGSVNVSFNGNCYQQVSFPIDNCAGGTADPVQPILRPISTSQGGAYIVAVPGTNPVDLVQVRRLVPGAYFDRAREGSFINAGGYSSFEAANSVSYFLRNSNLNARVIYGR
ncbi:SH3 domain-containing protein [Leptolyngbyaceae cyanobacterium UHCC 1019]